ncbi:hypothetical protein HMPREF9520_00952 [Enterococcus faecalis TX1467]|nr:hypothetical protein HMPREF9520_00952 [Enterococcus faecalis TX1467]
MTTCCRYFLLLFYSLIEAPETADSVSSASVHEEESATDKPTVDSVSSASIKE